MKNMKKLLATLTAFGLATVTGVNAVACSKPAATTPDLAQSFNTTYTATAGTTIDQGKWGLTNHMAPAFTYNFANVDAGLITSIITPKAKTPVTLVTKATDVASFPAAKNGGDELAQITMNTPSGTVNVASDNKTLPLKFTLKLWKDSGTGTTTGRWIDQSLSMDVTVNIDTTSLTSDLEKAFATSYNVAAGNPGNQSSWGLTNFTSPNFTYSFADVDPTTIETLIKPTISTPIILRTKAATVSNFPAAKNVGDEVAQILANTNDGSVSVGSDNKTVPLKFTLKLWKADSNKNYVDQQTTMVITVNIDTAQADNDLTTSFQTSYDTLAATLADLKNLGLTPAGDNQFTYKMADATFAALSSIIKPTDGTPVTIVTKATDVADFPGANKPGEELAQIIQNTPDSTLNVGSDNKTVAITFTLKLWKDDGTGSTTGKWVNQFTTMDVTINVDTTRASNDLSRLAQINNVTTLNIDVNDIKHVTPTQLIGATALQAVVQNAVAGLVADATTNDYTFAVAGDATGRVFASANLSLANRTFVQITAASNSTKLVPNSQTGWIGIQLPAANDLGPIAAPSFGNLQASNFSVANASQVTKAELINGIKANGTLLTALQAINANINDIADGNSLTWKIAKTSGGNDIGSDTVDATGVLTGVIVYITLTPGNSAYFSGIAQDGAGNGIPVQIPHLTND